MGRRPLRTSVRAAGFVAIVSIAAAATCACGERARNGSQRASAGAPSGSPGAPESAASAPSLVFACVGDTRPANEDDIEAYPTNVVSTIFQRIESFSPRPSFVVATGDYMFASTGRAGSAAAQLELFAQARGLYGGPLYAALGNHECTGATASNCGAAGADGITPNYAAFMDRLLAPLGVGDPFYVVHAVAGDGAWSAKVVVVAANAWSQAQAQWLESALAEATTYTFVVRHEPAGAVDAPGVAPSEAIVARHPYTLLLAGHSHTYRHDAGSREVVIGNGGAPLTSKDYGFGLFSRRGDGAIGVDMIDWRTGAADPDFHFAVRADGSPAPP